jgi:KDO2-lipid IV(A) lauroyltransferase
MTFKQARFWVLCRLAEGIYWGFYLLVKVLPPVLFIGVARPFLGLLITTVVPKTRIIKNLTAAFGQSYSLASKKGLARGVQEHFVKNLIDCFFQLRLPEYAQQTITIDGRHNLEAALGKGKGIIALGAHIGNFVLVGTRLGAEGLPFHSLFRMPKDKRIQAIIAGRIRDLRQAIIPSRGKRGAVATILQALKTNGIVFILADNLRSGKIVTELFGQSVRTSRGPVSLALRSGAPVLPIYLIRSYNGELRLIIEPEISLVRSGNVAADIIQNTALIASGLERLIRCYPDQWNWLTVRMRGTVPAGERNAALSAPPRDAARSPVTLHSPLSSTSWSERFFDAPS